MGLGFWLTPLAAALEGAEQGEQPSSWEGSVVVQVGVGAWPERGAGGPGQSSQAWGVCQEHAPRYC